MAVLDLALRDYNKVVTLESSKKKYNRDLVDKREATAFVESDLDKWVSIRKFWCKIAGINPVRFAERARYYVGMKYIANEIIICSENTSKRNDDYDHV